MADEPTQPEGTPPENTAERVEDDELDPDSEIKPGMSEQQIRDAGLAIDVPFESGMANPQRLRYDDEKPEEKPEPEEEQ